LPQSIRNIVIQFWTTQTIIFPNRKDVVKWQIFIKVNKEHVASNSYAILFIFLYHWLEIILVTVLIEFSF
jgi:hypothetical protein